MNFMKRYAVTVNFVCFLCKFMQLSFIKNMLQTILLVCKFILQTNLLCFPCICHPFNVMPFAKDIWLIRLK